MQSWCGAVEAGVVAAAPLRGEGSQQRRKRKREAASGKEGPLLGSVQWANPSAYKRAFRYGASPCWPQRCMVTIPIHT